MEATLQSSKPVERLQVHRREHAVDPSKLVDTLLHADFATDLERARRIAKWLDAEFAVAGYRFGFETLLGVVPVVGDTVTALIGLFPVLVARKHKLGKWIQFRMGMNLLIEWGVGSVPVVGDLFDTAMKANLRNVRLLERAAAAANWSNVSTPTDRPTASTLPTR